MGLADISSVLNLYLLPKSVRKLIRLKSAAGFFGKCEFAVIFRMIGCGFLV